MLILISLLGKGHYGDVFLAKAFGIQDSDGAESLVMVKSLLSRSTVHVDECLHEIDLFSRLNHEHVVQLLGICREAEPVFLVMEYCEWVNNYCPIQLSNCRGHLLNYHLLGREFSWDYFT